MKRVIYLLITLVIVATVVPGGLSCAKPVPAPSPTLAPKPTPTVAQTPTPSPKAAPTPAPSPAPAPAAPSAPAKETLKQVRFLSGSVGSQNFGSQSYWMEELSKVLKIPCGAFPGSTEANPPVLARGDAEFSYSNCVIGYDAYRGVPPFNKPLDNLRFVTGLCLDIGAAIVRADSKINSITELNGKKVGLGPKGAGSGELALLQMAAVGITPETIQKARGMTTTMDYASMGDALLDGTLDVAWHIAPHADIHSAFQMVAQRFGTKILEIPEDALKAVLQKNPLCDMAWIESGVHKGNPKRIYGVGHAVTVLTRAELSEDFIYQFMKLIYSEKVASTTSKQYSVFSFFGDTENGLRGGKTVPMHPGAAKFWSVDRKVDLAAKGIVVK